MNSEEQEQRIVIRLTDEQDALWRTYGTLTNEMMMTTAGRPLYPSLGYCIQGLAIWKHYAVAIEFHRVDDYCYSFNNGEWKKDWKSYMSRAEANSKVKKIWHKNGVMLGQQWNELKVLAFDNVLITSNPSDKGAHNVYLCSMCKYIPVLSVYELPMYCRIPNENSKLVALLKLDHTEFIAVRNYKNKAVASLKVPSDPWWSTKPKPTRKYTRTKITLEQILGSSQPPKRGKCEVSTKLSTGIPPLPASGPPPIIAQPTVSLFDPLPAAPFAPLPPPPLPLEPLLPYHFAPNPFMTPPSPLYSQILALQAAMMANASFYQFSGFPAVAPQPNFNRTVPTSFLFPCVDSEQNENDDLKL